MSREPVTSQSYLPDDLYAHIFALGQFTFPHRDQPAQQAAKMALHQALAREDIGALPEALRALGRAFSRDGCGAIIPWARNRTLSRAMLLADEVEIWLTHH